MIAIDSSAIIAILRGEAEADKMLRAIVDSDGACLSALSLLEISMVLAGRSGDQTAWDDLDELIVTAAIEIVPQEAAQTHIARDAFLRYGKGRHPAGLNLGDCVSYALARVRGLPLLFKGEDFARTDVVPGGGGGPCPPGAPGFGKPLSFSAVMPMSPPLP